MLDCIGDLMRGVNMAYKVRIKNNETEEIRERTMDLDWHEASYFWWTDGNFGCDCNRRAEFIRASGRQPTEEEWDLPCSTGDFTVIDVLLEDGTLIEIEGDDYHVRY